MEIAITSFVLKISFLLATLDAVLGIKVKANITRGPSYEHPVRTSDLMCYICINEVNSDNCMTMANETKIHVLRCREKETFCKVRRFETRGELTTFDRQCADDCTPGCSQSIINEECISCCSTSLCNTDNGAETTTHSGQLHTVIWLVSVIVSLLWKGTITL